MATLPPDRWKAIDDLFSAALDRPAAERDAFLRAAAGDDDHLLAAVRALLDSDVEAERVLGESATGFAAPLLESPAEEAGEVVEGVRVGAYRLIREIGRGGMGTVFLAERADRQFERRVAVKRVKRGLDTDEILQRFRYERQILASLQHPNIAALYDGAATEDGRPFLVMEYVDGQPIDRFCDSMRLDVDARLALFRTVCRAVQHAHESLVVHLDLKPSNILVTPAGVPKLLDFGIAKLLDAVPADGSPHTRTGMRVLTPEYASPEQIDGGPVTTASDVYALGVVLFQLLTGRRPFERDERGRTTPARRAADTLPDRPSTVAARAAGAVGTSGPAKTPHEVAAARSTTPDRLRRRLTGDLDTIVLKALAPEPERRYPSVQALLDDLERHLAGLPVSARADTLGYRAGKFLRRHRAGVAAAAGILLSLTGGLGTAMWQAGRAAEERDIAHLERDRAEEVVGFMTRMLAGARPDQARGSVPTVLDLLRESEARIDTALASQPDVQAAMWHVVGHVYGSLGEAERARPALERALQTRRALYGERSEQVAATAEELANVVEAAGNYVESEPLRMLVLDIRGGPGGAATAELATALGNLGYLFFRKGDFGRSEEFYTRALNVARRLPGEPLALANALNSMGALHQNRGQWAEAEPLFRESLAIRRSALGDDHPLIPNTLTNLAALLRDNGNEDRAEPLFREALAIRERILPPDHPDLALSAVGLGYLLQKKGELQGAEDMFRRSLRINEARYGRRHPEVGLAMSALAGVLRQSGGHAEAERMLHESLGILRESLGPRHPRVSMPLISLGQLLVEQRRAREAEPLLREAVDLRAAGLGETHFATMAARYELAECLGAMRRFAEAERLLLDARRRLEQSPEGEAQMPELRQRLERLSSARLNSAG